MNNHCIPTLYTRRLTGPTTTTITFANPQNNHHADSIQTIDVGKTIFSVMSRMAVQHGDINLGQGFPDFVLR